MCPGSSRLPSEGWKRQPLHSTSPKLRLAERLHPLGRGSLQWRMVLRWDFSATRQPSASIPPASIVFGILDSIVILPLTQSDAKLASKLWARGGGARVVECQLIQARDNNLHVRVHWTVRPARTAESSAEGEKDPSSVACLRRRVLRAWRQQWEANVRLKSATSNLDRPKCRCLGSSSISSSSSLCPPPDTTCLRPMADAKVGVP